MSYMFGDAKAFNQSLSEWDTGSVQNQNFPGMFRGALGFHTPPCQPGRFPANNGLGCQDCPTGRYAWQGADSCEVCGEGHVPMADRSGCMPCGQGQVPTADRSNCLPCPSSWYAPVGADECVACAFPRFVNEEHCIWWHLPLIAVVAGCLMVAVAAYLFTAHRRAKRTARIEEVKCRESAGLEEGRRGEVEGDDADGQL